MKVTMCLFALLTSSPLFSLMIDNYTRNYMPQYRPAAIPITPEDTKKIVSDLKQRYYEKKKIPGVDAAELRAIIAVIEELDKVTAAALERDYNLFMAGS